MRDLNPKETSRLINEVKEIDAQFAVAKKQFEKLQFQYEREYESRIWQLLRYTSWVDIAERLGFSVRSFKYKFSKLSKSKPHGS